MLVKVFGSAVFGVEATTITVEVNTKIPIIASLIYVLIIRLIIMPYNEKSASFFNFFNH